MVPRWRAGTGAGYRSDGEPRPRPEYRDDYYGAFLLDPDGNSAEAVHHGAMRESGKIDRRTVIATTVHPIQILRENLLMTAHDIPVGLVATPRAVIGSSGSYPTMPSSSRARSSTARVIGPSEPWIDGQPA